MPSFETAVRLIVIGQELLIAAIFLFGAGTRVARLSGALLLLSIAAYLYNSDTTLRTASPELLPIVMLLAMIVPYCLWAFARAIFESSWPSTWITSLFVAFGIVVWGIFIGADYVGAAWVNAANIAMHLASLVIVLHALLFTIRDRPDDLIERRRSFRVFFVVIVAVQVVAVLIVELVLGAATPPAWLEMVNVIVIALLTLGLAIPMLRLNAEFFELAPASELAQESPTESSLGAADRALKGKLLELMGEGYYRKTGLTIPMLAAELTISEHQLRRLINGHLEYRNFSAFLNSYRIREAKAQLVDPERARIPVLTTALELGYASLGPFNRAFKASTGVTPTDFRQNSSNSVADSKKIPPISKSANIRRNRRD